LLSCLALSLRVDYVNASHEILQGEVNVWGPVASLNKKLGERPCY